MLAMHNFIIGEDKGNFVEYVANLNSEETKGFCREYLDAYDNTFLQCFADEGKLDDRAAQIKEYTSMVKKLREINRNAIEQHYDSKALMKEYVKMFGKDFKFLGNTSRIINHKLITIFRNIIDFSPDIGPLWDFLSDCKGTVVLKK
jgi:hypothetical protein